MDLKSENKTEDKAKNKFNILIEVSKNLNEPNQQSAEKLQKLLNELKKYNTVQDNTTNNKIRKSDSKEPNPEIKLTEKNQKEIKDILTRLKELDKSQLNKLKEMLINKISDGRISHKSRLISKIKVSNNTQFNENIKIQKILTEINKLTNKEIKTIQKAIAEHLNTSTKKNSHKNTNGIKANKNRSDQILKDNVKPESNNNSKSSNKNTKNIDLNFKENNAKANNKKVRLDNIKVKGVKSKDTSQVKQENKFKERVTFNNLEFELKNKKTNKKYKKVNNLKFFSEKHNNQGKEQITKLKNFDIKSNTNKQNSTAQFRKLIEKNNLLNQIKNKVNVKNLSNKNQQIEIQLKPDSLGKMKINLSMESNKIVGKILVENDVVQNYLENNLQELKSDLLAKGLQIDQFNIESETKDFNQNQNNQDSNSFFQQYKGNHQENNQKRHSNTYNFLSSNEFVEENVEQIKKAGWRTLETIKGGFEYFA